jgi:hypothetical protein
LAIQRANIRKILRTLKIKMGMQELIEFVEQHTSLIGSKTPGRGFSLVTIHPALHISIHVPLDSDIFRELTKSAENEGVQRPQMNPFDGRRWPYTDISRWFGDDRLALRFMAIACHLGITHSIKRPSTDPEQEIELFEQGDFAIELANPPDPKLRASPQAKDLR